MVGPMGSQLVLWPMLLRSNGKILSQVLAKLFPQGCEWPPFNFAY
jgi:hypothetical protein